jgi:hypothetical protein
MPSETDIGWAIPTKVQTIAIVAMLGVQLLDVSGPLAVFVEANVWAGRPAYAGTQAASPHTLLLTSSEGRFSSMCHDWKEVD